ncbi:MAG: glycoside hydrolase family 5 protein [Kineosporiaceae bacterium]
MSESRHLWSRARFGAVGAALAAACLLIAGCASPADTLADLRARSEPGAVVPPPSGPGASAPAAPAAGESPPGPPAAEPAALPSEGRFATAGASIVDHRGRPVQFKGVNWFGLETADCAPHGLWARSLDEVMDQIAEEGFTLIRLPFSNQCLEGVEPSTIDTSRNPDLVGLDALELMDAVVAAAAEREISVLLDRHRPGYSEQSELWYTADYPEERWIEDWVMLAEHYRDDPTVVGADLHNEPHGDACWGCGDPDRDWRAAAERAGDAIGEVNPEWLIVVEGVEAQADGTTTWWGGGLADVRDAPVELQVPGRVVYSAHDYPATVARQDWFDDADYPANLPTLWQERWGYLVDEGIAPVLMGEFGTEFETESDRQWLATLVAYLDEREMSYAYWSWNPNSGDTGGLVAEDWSTPERAKLDALAPLLD